MCGESSRPTAGSSPHAWTPQYAAGRWCQAEGPEAGTVWSSHHFQAAQLSSPVHQRQCGRTGGRQRRVHNLAWQEEAARTPEYQ